MSSKSDRETKPRNKREGIGRRTLLLSTTSLVAASGISSATTPLAQAQQAEEILPKPEPPFQGKIATRAALITGRNHHSVASGSITEFATGYPGYDSLVPKSAGSVGAVLKDNGYNTAWFGKMHNVPDWMSSQAGPFDLWPTGLGFEHF